jgi:TolA-binding protein
MRFPMSAKLATLLVLPALVAGCAGVAEVAGTATTQDLMQLRADVTQLQLAVSRARADAEKQTAAVEALKAERSAISQRQADDLARRIEGLSASVTAMSGRLEEMAARLDAVSRRPAPPAAGAPPAVVAPPTAGPPPPAAVPPLTAVRPPAPSPGAPSTPSAPGSPFPAPATPAAPPVVVRPQTGGLQPQDVYQAAYIDFSKGSYPLAVAGFREFLRRFPDHALAGAAQYWIGEAHFSLARGYTNAGQTDKATETLEQAVQEFRKVQANYARSDKAATALYKEALALLDLKQPAVAQARLQYLVDNFPQAEEAPLARERLAALKPANQ